MKFQPDSLAGVNTVTRFGPEGVQLGSERFNHSVLVPWRGQTTAWNVAALADLTPEHFARILPFKPEIVIFGSGQKLKFVPPALYSCLIEHRVGIETMDTAAACRTFNVLATEGRAVLAALLVNPPG